MKDLMIPSYFLSHSREFDLRLAQRIEAKLARSRREGVLETWRDLRSLDPGDQFTDRILNAISSSSGAIVILSEDYYASDYLQSVEWPAIRSQVAQDSSYGLFLVASTLLDDDDEIAATYNFACDPAIALRFADDSVRDRELTILAGAVRQHAISNAKASFSPGPVRPIGSSQGTVDVAVAQRSVGQTLKHLSNVPTLPVRYVNTAEEESAILALDQANGLGLVGDGGTGKSVVAASVGRSLTRKFRSGVFWLTVGEDATREALRKHQERLARQILDEPGLRIVDVNHGLELLRRVLSERQVLVIVDDIWHPWQARLLDLCASGFPSKVIYTSRHREAIPIGTPLVEFERLSDDEARRYLAAAAPLVAGDGQDLASIVRSAGGLRLSLSVLASAADANGSWSSVSMDVDALAERYGSGDAASSAHKAFHVAVRDLDADAQEVFWTMAAFPVDARIPIGVVTALLPRLGRKVEALVRILDERQLIGLVVDEHGSGPEIVLHDHTHDFLLLESPIPPIDVHLRIWELAKEALATSGWAAVQEQPYIWENLVWHAIRAGLNVATVVDLVSDPKWLTLRLEGEGPEATCQDVESVREVAGASGSHPLSALAMVLRHGDLFRLALSRRDLAATVACWLDALSIDRPPESGPRLDAGFLAIPSKALRRTTRAHAGHATGVTFFDGGAQLATAGYDGLVRLWRSATGDLVASLRTNQRDSRLYAVAVSPDGRLVGAGAEDGKVHVWLVSDGSVVHEFEASDSAVEALDFHPSGEYLAVGRPEGRIDIWSTWNGRLHRSIETDNDLITSLRFGSTGEQLAIGDAGGAVEIVSVLEPANPIALGRHEGRVYSVRFDSDESFVGSAAQDAKAIRWPVGQGEPDVLRGHSGEVMDIDFHPNGRYLFTASADGTVRRWDVEEGGASELLKAHTGIVRGLAIRPDGDELATTSADGTLRAWQTLTLKTTASDGATHAGPVRGVDYRARRVLTASADGSAGVWDASTGVLERQLFGHRAPVRAAQFDAAGGRFVTSSQDCTALVWDADSGKQIVALEGHSAGVRKAVFDPVGSRVATASADGTTGVWDPESGKELMRFGDHSGVVFDVVFDPRNQLIATAGADGVVVVRDLGNGSAIRLKGSNKIILSVSFSPQDRVLAASGVDGSIRIWDTDSGELMVELTDHVGPVRVVTFEAATGRLLSASHDGTARIWSANDWRCEVVLALGVSGSAAWCDGGIIVGAGWHWARIGL